jgi:cytochrome P450
MTVTDKPVIDFDHWSPQYRANWQQIAAELHATGHPLAWSPHHDGFWVLADWDAVQHVASDWETFTSVNDLDGTENGGLGQVIPRQPYRLFLGESDPPLHTGRRKLEAPFFTPKALRRWRPVTRRFLAEAINSVIETGRANLIDDVLVPTTARTTLHVLGYDTDAWRDPADVAHKGTFLTYDDPEYPHGQQKRMREAFRDMLTARSKAPTGDLISALATGLVEGSPLSLDEGESMMNALVFGGFDTTVSTTASALIWMDQHPHEAARIREDAGGQGHRAARAADRQGRAGDDVARRHQPRPQALPEPRRDRPRAGERPGQRLVQRRQPPLPGLATGQGGAQRDAGDDRRPPRRHEGRPGGRQRLPHLRRRHRLHPGSGHLHPRHAARARRGRVTPP